MSETTKIEWCDHTFNPWIGCTKVHAGCTNCYAESYAKRYGKAEWGPHGTRVKTSESYWKQPHKWNREAEKSGERRRVFCASLADVFEDWDGMILNAKGHRLFKYIDHNASAIDGSHGLRMDDLRRELFSLIDATPHLDWLLLTKRPENVRRMWPYPNRHGSLANGISPQVLYRGNVWLGTSISDQTTADTWTAELHKLRDLVPVLFLSVEPLLGPIEQLPLDGIDWLIAGGESGPHARPCDVSWIRSIRDQCSAAGVDCFIKQLGSMPCDNGSQPAGGWWKDQRTAWQDSVDGDWKFGRYLKDKKGGDITEWPDDLRVRQYPKEHAHART